MANRGLRPVPANAPRSPRKRKVGVAGAVEDDRRALLVALRARLAVTIDDEKTPAHALASLTRRLMEMQKEIEAIDAGEHGDDVGRAAATADEEWAAS